MDFLKVLHDHDHAHDDDGGHDDVILYFVVL